VSFSSSGVVADLVAVGSPLSAGAAQLTERRGIAAGLGDEVTAKAEHVRPLPDSTQAGPLRQTDCRHRHLHELLGHAALAQLLGARAAADDLLVRALAGVLRDVRRDLPAISRVVIRTVAHDTRMQLLTEAHLDRGATDAAVEHRSPTGKADRGGQLVGRDRNAGR
jgi:hypothetical protein